jgi:outer membrane protein OmpA-like peptidoglycan-associated protein
MQAAALLALACAAVAGANPARAQAAPLESATAEQLVERLQGKVTAPPVYSKSAFGGAATPLPGQCKADVSYAGTATRTFVPQLEYPTDSSVQVDLKIQFEINSARLLPVSRPLLDQLAQALQTPALQSGRFIIAGHTDITGTVAFNEALSCARAITVRHYLMDRGVPGDRLGLYGLGSRQLLPGRAADDPLHRRVEVRRAPDA